VFLPTIKQEKINGCFKMAMRLCDRAIHRLTHCFVDISVLSPFWTSETNLKCVCVISTFRRIPKTGYLCDNFVSREEFRVWRRGIGNLFQLWWSFIGKHKLPEYFPSYSHSIAVSMKVYYLLHRETMYGAR
jgi:hypothetical protein